MIPLAVPLTLLIGLRVGRGWWWFHYGGLVHRGHLCRLYDSRNSGLLGAPVYGVPVLFLLLVSPTLIAAVLVEKKSREEGRCDLQRRVKM